jgi:hypothetical protein
MQPVGKGFGSVAWKVAEQKSGPVPVLAKKGKKTGPDRTLKHYLV